MQIRTLFQVLVYLIGLAMILIPLTLWPQISLFPQPLRQTQTALAGIAQVQTMERLEMMQITTTTRSSSLPTGTPQATATPLPTATPMPTLTPTMTPRPVFTVNAPSGTPIYTCPGDQYRRGNLSYDNPVLIGWNRSTDNQVFLLLEDKIGYPQIWIKLTREMTVNPRDFQRQLARTSCRNQ
ncbi:hypothetical protein EYB53_001950 [Candidatus Chloroploca sp. M-50]|uniref:Uncharacterized protein n=1 Tax=Candidatus Chloroploca mongolica TaxID=2528176 RepID=A0ABS4D4U4_9CHLR|nr:hypothetical protein [Candidatus Chloroploca mongolica]MBP1464461.1 hypothetical protein [Candidatus Chloroploca mongolica]